MKIYSPEISGSLIISGSIIPEGSGSHDLGSVTNPFRDLYVTQNSIKFIDTVTREEISRISVNRSTGEIKLLRTKGKTVEQKASLTGDTATFDTISPFTASAILVSQSITPGHTLTTLGHSDAKFHTLYVQHLNFSGNFVGTGSLEISGSLSNGEEYKGIYQLLKFDEGFIGNPSSNEILISLDSSYLKNYLNSQTVISSSAQITSLPSVDTGDLTEGSNLYYTDARVKTKLNTEGVISGSVQVSHDSTTGFVANEHIDHSGVTLTAGDGLTGGGDITTGRSFAVDSTVVRTSGTQTIGGDKTFSDNVTIQGNLQVTGTTTTVNSTTVSIADNIIEVNGTGAANGGILVKDVTSPGTVSGSLLWDGTGNYWKAGTLGSENRVLTTADEGSGNGLDADTVDGQEGSYYTNASNINAGTIGDAYLPGTISSDITGNSATTTKLATARTIGGVSFDGSANINLPGVNTAGNQNTSGNAATATKWATARTITLGGDLSGNVSLDGSANVTLTAAVADDSHTHDTRYLRLLSDSEQTGDFGVINWNEGAGRINSDPRINSSGFDSDSINIHWWATTAAGASYGRVGHALYNGSAYQYLHTKASQNNIYVNNNAILHAGNYNSYSPTLTGGNASGTWGISITGNAATATSATSSTYASVLSREDNRTISPSELAAGNLKFGFTSWGNNNTSPYADFLHLRSYTDSSGGSDNLVMFKKSGIGMRIWQQSWGSSTAYSSYVDVLDSGNYNSYSPTLTGGNASGTWGISITGNADTVDSIQGANILNKQTTTYYNLNTWLQSSGTHLLYSPSSGAGTHFYPGDLGDYGSFRTTGRKNSWGGYSIEGRVVFMHNGSSNYGLYDDVNNQWNFYATLGGASDIRYAGTAQLSAENGYGLAANQMRSPIFYDSADTTYYLDPGGNGTRAGYINGNLWINPKSESYGEGVTFYMPSQNTWGGLRWYRNGSAGNFVGNWALGYFGNEASNDIGFHNGTNGWRLDHSFHNTTAGSFRAPLFYDSANTTYYLDPASTGVSLKIAGNADIGTGAANTGTAIFHGNGSGDYGRIRFYGAGSNIHTIHSFSTAWQSGNTRLSGASINLSGHSGVTLGPWNAPWVIVNSDYLEHSSDIRTPIFYDSNNTGYYIDPASTSNINTMQMAGPLRMYAGSYEGSILFGSNSTWRTGIRQHDDADAELRIWAKNANGMIFLATGYDGEPAAISRPTNGLVVQNNNVGIGNFSSSDPSYDLHVADGGIGYAASSFRAPIFYDTDTNYYVDPNSTSYVAYLGRRAHHTGHLVGSYNSVGANSTNSNPIYVIGSSYNPASTTLGNMYGIGYSHPNASFISFTGASGWGMYVAADGDARVWLDGSTGRISAKGNIYAPVYYDYNDTGYYADPASTSNFNALNVGGKSVVTSDLALDSVGSIVLARRFDYANVNNYGQTVAGNALYVADTSGNNSYPGFSGTWRARGFEAMNSITVYQRIS